MKFFHFYSFLFLAEFIRAQNPGRMNLFVDERAWNKFGAFLASNFYPAFSHFFQEIETKNNSTVRFDIGVSFSRLINQCSNFLNFT